MLSLSEVFFYYVEDSLSCSAIPLTSLWERKAKQTAELVFTKLDFFIANIKSQTTLNTFYAVGSTDVTTITTIHSLGNLVFMAASMYLLILVQLGLYCHCIMLLIAYICLAANIPTESWIQSHSWSMPGVHPPLRSSQWCCGCPVYLGCLPGPVMLLACGRVYFS